MMTSLMAAILREDREEREKKLEEAQKMTETKGEYRVPRKQLEVTSIKGRPEMVEVELTKALNDGWSILKIDTLAITDVHFKTIVYLAREVVE